MEPHILCAYEYYILECLKNNELPEPKGAAWNAACEFLRGNGYITRRLEITQKGLEILESRR